MLKDYNSDPIFEIFEYLRIKNGADAASISEALEISPGSVQLRLDWLERSSYICLQQKDNIEFYKPLRKTATGLEDVARFIHESRRMKNDNKNVFKWNDRSSQALFTGGAKQRKKLVKATAVLKMLEANPGATTLHLSIKTGLSFKTVETVLQYHTEAAVLECKERDGELCYTTLVPNKVIITPAPRRKDRPIKPKVKKSTFKKAPTQANLRQLENQERNNLILKMAQENPGNTSDYIAGRIGMGRNVAGKVLLQFVHDGLLRAEDDDGVIKFFGV